MVYDFSLCTKESLKMNLASTFFVLPTGRVPGSGRGLCILSFVDLAEIILEVGLGPDILVTLPDVLPAKKAQSLSFPEVSPIDTACRER